MGVEPGQAGLVAYFLDRLGQTRPRGGSNYGLRIEFAGINSNQGVVWLDAGIGKWIGIAR